MKFSRLFYCFIVLLLIFVFIFSFFNSLPVFAICEVREYSNSEEYDRAIKECQKEIEARLPAQNKNKEDLERLEKNIDSLKKLIQGAEKQINILEKQIFDREVDLGYQKEILATRVRSYYIRSHQYSPLLLFLSSESAIKLARELAYRQMATDEDKEVIIGISQDLKKLGEDKISLDSRKDSLAKSKVELDQQAEELRKEVEKFEGFVAEIETKIAQLTAKQEALLAEKVEFFQASVGEVPLADDPNARPDFDPGFRPAWAGFSFGAPHRKGMSQYGAFGRAKAGQSAEQILKAYYGDVRIEHRDLPSTISTAVGTLPFEDNYMKGIAEMPSSWGNEGGYEALKAQAIAARSYAIRAGKPICITESCQVYSSSKVTNPAAGNWHRAVDDTRGMVIVSNQSNDIVSAWYASTAGGYVYSYTSVGHTTPGIWDTSCGNQSCWTSEAWEKKANSPWFYKGWYRTRSGASCGRNHPWLTEDEFTDVLNAVVVYRSGQGTEHILPIDYVSCFGTSGDPWSIEQMRNEANNHGGAITSVSTVSTTYGSDGKTAKLVFSTNRGSLEVSGEEFKTVFNLRAPGRISLKSQLFNVEKK